MNRRDDPDTSDAHRLAFRDLETEHDRVDVAVDGDIPGWLDGVLHRNGPGRFTVGDERLRHWFDGLALLRRFAIEGASNRVRFSARFLESEEYASVTERGRLKRGQFGTPASTSLLAHLRGLLDGTLTDNASIGVHHDGDVLQAITETPRGVVVDPETLAVDGHVDRARGLPTTGVLGHPHETSAGDAVVNVGTRIGRESGYVLYRHPYGGDPEVIARYPASNPAYVHSFGLTARYAVLFESPFRLSPRSLLTPGAFVDTFTWQSAADARFLVFDRGSGDLVASPRVAPAFVYHHANAFEDGGDVVVDVVAYPDDDAITGLALSTLQDPAEPVPAGELRRYRVPVSGGGGATGAIGASGGRSTHDERRDEPGASGVRSYVLHAGPVEFPTTNYGRVNGRRYRYCYLAGNTAGAPTSLANRLVKVDLEPETEVASWRQPNALVGEPLFVPRKPVEGIPDTGRRDDETSDTQENEETAGIREDDGVIITVVLDGDAARSALVVLDARDLSELARATLPVALPYGFHGQFYRRDAARPRRSMA